MQDSLGDRMKANYEDRARHYLTRRMPVIVRVDGRAFHTLTRQMDRPFDRKFMDCMYLSALDVADEMQGCKAVYVQSDEASFLLTDYDALTTEAWFDYNQQKIASVAASLMSVQFNVRMKAYHGWLKATFDGRAFNVPREEVSNYFLWRVRDWARNSIFMYARSFFSDAQLLNKKQPDVHEMLHGIGKNWATDLDELVRNGTFGYRVAGDAEHHPSWETTFDMMPNYASVDALVAPLLTPTEP